MTLLESVRTIGEKAFYSSGLENLTVNNTNMNTYRGFADCKKLKKVIINNEALISDNCFENCTALTDLQLNGQCQLGKQSFMNTGLTELYVPYGVILGKESFKNCTSLNKVQFDCEEVGNSAFDGCTAIKSVIFGEGVNTVAADWAGTSLSNPSMYVKDHTTMFYGKTTVSPFGASGTTDIYYTGEKDDLTSSITSATGEKFGRIYAINKSYDDNDADRLSFTASNAVALRFNNYGYKADDTDETYTAAEKERRARELAEKLGDAVTNLKDIAQAEGHEYDDQTGIYAECDEKLFVGEILDKGAVTVRVIGGNNAGALVDKNNFFIMRDSDYNDIVTTADRLTDAEGNKASKMSEILAQAEHIVQAREADLDMDENNKPKKASTLRVWAVAPSTASENGIFAASFDVTIEEKSAAAYAYRKYGTYSEIIKGVGEIEMELEAMQDEVDNYKKLLDYIDSILTDSSESSLADLRDKLDKVKEELQTLYDQGLTDEAPEVQALKTTAKALDSILDKGMTIKELKDQLLEKTAKVEELKQKKDALFTAIHDLDANMNNYKGAFTFLHKQIDGSNDAYTIFINNHEYRWYPSEDDNNYVPEGSLESAYTTLYTAHVDLAIDPDATDLDNEPDGEFKFYVLAGKAYILGTTDTYTNNEQTLIANAYHSMEQINQTLLDVEKSLGDIKKDMLSTVNQLKATGYTINVDENTTDSELMDAIKDKVADLVTDYKKIKQALSEAGLHPDDPNFDPEKILEELLKLYTKIEDVENNLKTALAGTDGEVAEDDQRTYAELLEAITRLKDNYDAAVNDPDFANKLDQAQQRIGELEEQITTLEGQIAEKDAEIEELRKNGGNSGKSGENGYSKEYVEKLQKEIAGYKDQVDELNELIEELKNNGAAEETIKELETKAETLQNRILELLEENAKLKGSNAALEEYNDTLVEDLVNTKEENLEIQTELIELGKEKSKVVTVKDPQVVQPSTVEPKVVQVTPAPQAATTTQPAVVSGGGTTGSTGSTKTTTSDKESTTKTTEVKEACVHEWTYKTNDDGTHTKTCKKCKETVTENHKYDSVTNKCDCGQTKKEDKTISVKPAIDQATCNHIFDYMDNKNGTHTATCQICHITISKKHEFDKDGICVCGAKDETKVEEEEAEEEETLAAPNWMNTKTAEVSTIEPVEKEAAAEEAPVEEEGGLSAGVIALIVLIAGGGAFAVYWFFLKDKLGKKNVEEEDEDDDDIEDFISSDEAELNNMDASSDMFADGGSDDEALSFS